MAAGGQGVTLRAALFIAARTTDTPMRRESNPCHPCHDQLYFHTGGSFSSHDHLFHYSFLPKTKKTPHTCKVCMKFHTISNHTSLMASEMPQWELSYTAK